MKPMKNTATTVLLAFSASAAIIGASVLVGDQTKEQRAASPNLIVKNAKAMLFGGIALTAITLYMFKKQLHGK